MTKLEDVELINTHPAMGQILVDYMNEAHPTTTLHKIETIGDTIHMTGRQEGIVHCVSIGGTVE